MNFGLSPVADRLLTDLKNNGVGAPTRFPLEVVLCSSCHLLQLTESLDPSYLFGGDYPYLSSVVDTVVQNAAQNLEEVSQIVELDPTTLIVEVASNDGYLLSQVDETIPVLGIDPSRPAVERAQDRGVRTIHEFFGSRTAREISAEYGKARVIFANNVLAHVRDLNGFVDGLAHLLAPNGLARIEVHYLLDLIEGVEFDTIYHQHLCYFSLHSLIPLFQRHQLHVQDARRIAIHGGSIRLTVGHEDRRSTAVEELLQLEEANGLHLQETYLRFSKKAGELAAKLKSFLETLKADGYKVAAYGAAAKGTTLLHYAEIDGSLLDYVVDRNDFKHGRFMDGPNLPIRPVEVLLEEQPDFVVLLAWNHAKEILPQQEAYRRAGGKFIIPVPELTVV